MRPVAARIETILHLQNAAPSMIKAACFIDKGSAYVNEERAFINEERTFIEDCGKPSMTKTRSSWTEARPPMDQASTFLNRARECRKWCA